MINFAKAFNYENPFYYTKVFTQEDEIRTLDNSKLKMPLWRRLRFFFRPTYHQLIHTKTGTISVCFKVINTQYLITKWEDRSI